MLLVFGFLLLFMVGSCAAILAPRGNYNQPQTVYVDDDDWDDFFDIDRRSSHTVVRPNRPSRLSTFRRTSRLGRR